MTATGYHAHFGGLHDAPPAQAPAPARRQWPTLVVVVGCIAMFCALLLTIAGVPAKVFYDANAAGERNQNTSYDMLAMSSSIDRNMKYIRANTAYGPGQYNGLLTSIKDSEAVVPTMADSVAKLLEVVTKIDGGLGSVQASTQRMGTDMTAMTAISAHSAQTMSSLDGGVGTIAGSMSRLLGATKTLTVKMGAIQRQAAHIATARTAPARDNAHQLNGVLPAGVPKPQTSLDAGGAHPAGRAVAQ